jgi:arsenical pump membrane protein
LILPSSVQLVFDQSIDLEQRGTVFQYFPIPELTRTLLTSLVGVLTLIGIMTRPFRWNEAMIAIGGAAVLLLLGLISPADAFLTLVRDWNTFLFFLGA